MNDNLTPPSSFESYPTYYHQSKQETKNVKHSPSVKVDENSNKKPARLSNPLIQNASPSFETASTTQDDILMGGMEFAPITKESHEAQKKFLRNTFDTYFVHLLEGEGIESERDIQFHFLEIGKQALAMEAKSQKSEGSSHQKSKDRLTSQDKGKSTEKTNHKIIEALRELVTDLEPSKREILKSYLKRNLGGDASELFRQNKHDLFKINVLKATPGSSISGSQSQTYMIKTLELLLTHYDDVFTDKKHLAKSRSSQSGELKDLREALKTLRVATDAFKESVQKKASSKQSKMESFEEKDFSSTDALNEEMAEEQISENEGISEDEGISEEKIPEEKISQEKRPLSTHSFKELSLKKFAQGKVKQVWEDPANPQNLYYTPIKDTWDLVFSSREKELKEEVKTARSIEYQLVSKGIDPAASNLALDMEEITTKWNGEYTVKTARGEGDLEKIVNQGSLHFPQSATIGLQIANGMKNLHDAGFVQGDIKLENVLMYRLPDGRMVAKVSDFGKTRQLKDGENVMYTGNPRYAAPEGRLSKEGEVFSTAIMIIRALEGELLTDSKTDMLLKPKNWDEKVNNSKRRGIEKFLVGDKNCPQAESDLAGKVKFYGRELQLATKLSKPENLKQAEVDIQEYINQLKEDLIQKYPDPGSEAKITSLCALLKHMTLSKPEHRPTMDDVVDSYLKIMGSPSS